MMALVSIIITGISLELNWCLEMWLTDTPDLLPVRSVATWRSYVNVIATMGRSLGGPVGGWLTDTVGWRWYVFEE